MKKVSAARIFGIATVLLVVVALIFSLQSPLSRSIRAGEPVLGLLIGTDDVDHARHSDTIVVVRYDPQMRALDLLSIPRDTRVDVPGLRVKKINEVYAYAYRSKKNHGSACRDLSQAVQSMLFSESISSPASVSPGADLSQISFYGQIDYKGFKTVIDLIGGVDVNVTEPMHYDDNWGKLHIHFEPGKYTLDGQKSLEYVRYRDSLGDYGRVMRQQEFMMNLLKRFTNPVNILKLPKLVWISVSSIHTNLSWLDRVLILTELKDLARDHIRLIQLPGRMTREGYWMTNSEDVQATVALFSGKNLAGEPDSAFASVTSAEEAGTILTQPTVEVWNASSKKKLAEKVTQKLRAAGFDVVKYGNYSSRQQKTYVRDRKGDKHYAQSIAQALSASSIQVFTRVESNPLVDVEVILGEDYQVE